MSELQAESTIEADTKCDITPVDEEVELAKPVKKAKARHTSYLITINTNTPIRTGAEEHLPELKRRLTNAYNALSTNILDLIEYKAEDGNVDLIDNVSMTGNMEIGSERNMLHLHAILSIKHRTKIRLDYKKARLLIHEQCPNAHFDCRLFHHSFAYLLDYISKNKQMLLRNM